MSSSETRPEGTKWVVISRDYSSEPYEVYVHPNAKQPTRFTAPENAKSLVYFLRKTKLKVYAVQETDLHKYGVIL
jgi:hypothetical protein